MKVKVKNEAVAGLVKVDAVPAGLRVCDLSHTKIARVDIVVPLLIYLLSELFSFARTLALHPCALHAVTPQCFS